MHDCFTASGLLLYLRAFFCFVITLLSLAGFLHILARSYSKIGLSMDVSDLFHRFRSATILTSVGCTLARLAFKVLINAVSGLFCSFVLLI